jgi:hypothetical protein
MWRVSAEECLVLETSEVSLAAGLFSAFSYYFGLDCQGGGGIRRLE